MVGAWFTDAQTNEIFGSRVRDMARFGLLMQNKGIWAGDTLLADTAYFNEMINSSQQLNKSYGYLWWLNGKQSYMVPQSQLVIPGYLIPNAPADTWCALGKNDQKLYVSQSTGLVVVRLGNDAGNPGLAPTIFDNLLWGEINKLFCSGIGSAELNLPPTATLFAVAGAQKAILDANEKTTCTIYNVQGKTLFDEMLPAGQHHIALPVGVHIGILKSGGRTKAVKLVIL
jgi:CubicO group peptidase (beta-lactamase class C family)